MISTVAEKPSPKYAIKNLTHSWIWVTTTHKQNKEMHWFLIFSQWFSFARQIMYHNVHCGFNLPPLASLIYALKFQIPKDMMHNVRQNLQLPWATCFTSRGKSNFTASLSRRGSMLSLEVQEPCLQSLYLNETASIESWRDDGSGTTSGGTYLIIRSDTATIVNANNVPTLTCTKNSNWSVL